MLICHLLRCVIVIATLADIAVERPASQIRQLTWRISSAWDCSRSSRSVRGTPGTPPASSSDKFVSVCSLCSGSIADEFLVSVCCA